VVGPWGKTDPIFWAHIIDNKKSCTTRVTAAAEEFLKKYPQRLSDLPDNYDISERAVNDVLDFDDITENH